LQPAPRGHHRGEPRLHRSPNILLIPGTSSLAHLRENIAGAGLELSEEDLAELDGIGAAS